MTFTLQHVLIRSVISLLYVHQSQAIEQTPFTKVLVTELINVSKAVEITEEDCTVKPLTTSNTYSLSLHKTCKAQLKTCSPVWQCFIKYTARGQGWHYSLCKPDPRLRRLHPLSLTSGELWPLSLQHLISPLNLRLTRSFTSKDRPLCLQPSSTNEAWKGIEERWRVAVSVLVQEVA